MTDDIAQAQARIAALETARMKDAVLAEAASHGLINHSDVDNISLDGVKVEADGTVSGVKKFVEGWKTNKPHWFSKSSATGGTAAASSPGTKTTPIKPGSSEAKQLEQAYFDKWAR